MENKKKVLLVRLSAMGDVIFTIPLANALTSAGYEVTWLVSEKGYSLVKNNPCVDKVILAPLEKWKKARNPLKNFFEYLSIVRSIRKEKYDIALDTQLILKSLLWMAFCGAKRRIVAKNYREFAILGGNEVMAATRVGNEPHAVKSYLKYAEYLGTDTTDVRVTLPETSQEVKSKVDDLLSPLDNKPFILAAPATTWDTKHWNRGKWKVLLENLKDDYNIVLSGTEKDSELLSYLDNGYLNLCGKSNLEELQELLSRAELVISMDSGTTHLAWATQKPKIVSIFCSTPESLYAPLGDENKYISVSAKKVCQPCHKRKCPKGTNECTNYPEVNEVYDAVIKLLKGE
ncbi:MAG: glycosyltransferase family 9 protein [Cyanobacteria bacterium RUI128]|nr:glycosyltransferase family 9 protein [Cyanobacteria bacterium RUI128]